MCKDKYPWGWVRPFFIDGLIFFTQLILIFKMLMTLFQIGSLRDDLMIKFGTLLILLAMVLSYRDKTIFQNNQRTIFRDIIAGSITEVLFLQPLVNFRKLALRSIFWITIMGTILLCLGSI